MGLQRSLEVFSGVDAPQNIVSGHNLSDVTRSSIRSL